jgi:hypothetical protein
MGSRVMTITAVNSSKSVFLLKDVFIFYQLLLCQLKYLAYGYFDLVAPPDKVAVGNSAAEKVFVSQQTKAQGAQPASEVEYDAAAVIQQHFKFVPILWYDAAYLNHGKTSFWKIKIPYTKNDIGESSGIIPPSRVVS